MHYDVVIAGLGTAGAITLIKCAKLGLSVLGIDRLSEMGGTGTAGGIGGYYYGSDGGYYKEINQKAKELQNEAFTDAPYELAGVKSVVLEREAIKAGAAISYNTHILSVKKNGNRVCSAECIKEGKKFEVHAKLFIDTTGNGDFSDLCGCEFIGGRDSDNVYMPYTNPVFIADPHVRVLNRDSGLIDMSDNTSYSKELVNSTAAYPFSWKVRDIDATYLKIAPLPGVRESRKVVCEKTVTFSDAIYQKSCNETVFYSFSNADTHEKCIAFEPDIAKDWYAVCNLWGVCMSVAIPMSSLIPKGVDGLLCGGRMLSVCHTLSSIVRMKSDMEKCGEVLSYMAYLSITKNIDVKNIPYSDLKPYLEKSGVLDEKNNVGYLNRTKTGLESFEFPKTIEQLEADLATDRESFAVFAAKDIKNSADLLVKIQNSHERKGKYAAIALGRMGDERAIPILREIAKNRDMTLPSGLKMTVPLGISAIYLLGKLKDRKIIPLLKEIIKNGGKFDKELFVSNEMFPEYKDLSFQFITHSIAVLKELANSYSDIKDDIMSFLKEMFVENEYDKNLLTLNVKAGIKLIPCPFDYTDIIRNYILA